MYVISCTILYDLRLSCFRKDDYDIYKSDNLGSDSLLQVCICSKPHKRNGSLSKNQYFFKSTMHEMETEIRTFSGIPQCVMLDSHNWLINLIAEVEYCSPPVSISLQVMDFNMVNKHMVKLMLESGFHTSTCDLLMQII